MKRRTFLQGGLAAGAGALGSSISKAEAGRSLGRTFKLKYAPHFGMFKHHAGDDLVAQLEFMADQGFTALEDNGMARSRDVATQERIAAAMERLGMEMGVFVAHADFSAVTFASTEKGQRERIRHDMKRAVEVARRVRARWCTVVPGCYAKDVPRDYQTATVIDNLRMASEICAEGPLTMVLEPLNEWTNHAGVFLTGIPQAYMICRAVDSPHCKILDDLYHQQITEGHLIANIDRAWNEIAYIQIGDNPGRKEPTTGEINYKNVFRHLHRKGYTGILGMEHGLSKGGKEGEVALLNAYREVDSFEV